VLEILIALYWNFEQGVRNPGVTKRIGMPQLGLLGVHNTGDAWQPGVSTSYLSFVKCDLFDSAAVFSLRSLISLGCWAYTRFVMSPDTEVRWAEVRRTRRPRIVSPTVASTFIGILVSELAHAKGTVQTTHTHTHTHTHTRFYSCCTIFTLWNCGNIYVLL
jgi:hypothetical protein